MLVITPYLRVKDTVKALEFYKEAFGAEEKYQLREPDGKVGHAEFSIQGVDIHISDEYPDKQIVGPETLGGTSVAIHLQVDDVDAVFNRAFQAGASIVATVQDQFFGERTGSLLDPFGHHWIVSTTIKEMSPQEMQAKYSALFVSEHSKD